MKNPTSMITIPIEEYRALIYTKIRVEETINDILADDYVSKEKILRRFGVEDVRKGDKDGR